MDHMILKTFLITLFCVFAGNAHGQNIEASLRDELLTMSDRDQQAREKCAGSADEQMRCYVKVAEEVDKPNTKRINEIFSEVGFPAARDVGPDGVKTFYLILQHSGDLELKRRCQKGMKKGFKEKVVSSSEYSSFIDRLLVDQHKPQIYGSNFEMKDGKLVMSATKDVKNLNARRKKIGLPPIDEYVKMLKDAYKLDVEIK